MEVIEKFIKSMNITTDIEEGRSGFNRGTRYCCFRVEARLDNIEEYIQYNCYSRHYSGKIQFEEGNTVKDINEGIFVYLGMDKEVSKYFESKTREMARNWFEHNM